MTARAAGRPPLDPAALERLRRLGGEELVRRMSELFLQLGAERIAAARAGLAAGDVEAVERAAHSLKSSAGNVGAWRLLEGAERAERAAEAMRSAAGTGTGELATLVDRMEAAFDEAGARLRRQVEGLAGR